jgi:hypothetical protein
MDKTGLPKYLNGKWGLSKYLYWQELRTRTEWRIPLGFSGRDLLSMYNDFPAINPYYTVQPDEEKAERNRRMNVIHCRRKRDQKRVELDDLSEECADLRETQEGLLEENRRLVDLVKVAIGTVERVEGEQCDTANQSGWLSAQTAEHCSSRSTGDTIPVHPVLTAYEQASTTNAASASSMGQLNPSLRGESDGRTQAPQPEGEQDRVSLGAGVGPLRQGPVVLPGSLGSTNVQEETSSPFLISATHSEEEGSLFAAAQGMLSLLSQS